MSNVSLNYTIDNNSINILKNTQTSENSLESERLNSLSFSAGKKVIKPRSRKQLDYFDLVKKKQMFQ